MNYEQVINNCDTISVCLCKFIPMYAYKFMKIYLFSMYTRIFSNKILPTNDSWSSDFVCISQAYMQSKEIVRPNGDFRIIPGNEPY